MADFFEDLKNGFDELKDKVEDGIKDLKEEAEERRHAEKEQQAADNVIIEEAPAKFLEVKSEELIKSIVKGTTIVSPMTGTIHDTAVNANQKGISLDSGLGIVITFPAADADKVEVLVKKGQAVEKGTPLFEVARDLLPKLTMDLVNPNVVPGFDNIKEKILRVA